MRAVIVERPGQVRVDTLPDPAPQPDGVVVRVGACGVCGTDLHIVDGEFPPTPYPITPGHEFAGEVVAVGSRVDTVTVGDRVAVDPSLFCGRCAYCRIGRGNLCANWGAIGDTVGGAFAEYVAVPAANCYRMPPGMDFRLGATVEPLSCAVHGLRRLAPRPGDTVLVVGAGTMGLLLVQLLVRSGAATVAVVDTNPGRLAIAVEVGATATGTTLAEVAEAAPLGFDRVVDATGVPAVIEEALSVVARGGTFMVFGVAPGEARIALSPYRVYNDELTVVGSMAVLHSFGPALALLQSGAVHTGPLLGEAFPLGRFDAAVQAVRRGQSGRGVKVQVLPYG